MIINGSTGLRINAIDGLMIDISGEVEYDPGSDTYYCADQSFPSSIVSHVHIDVGETA